MKQEFDCIVCPMSCHIVVQQTGEDLQIVGHSCPRGEVFVRQELVCPMRLFTTTIRIRGALHPLLPVMTSQSIARDKISDIMKVCKELEVEAPVVAGQILQQNVAGSGADLIASRSYKYNDRTNNFTSHQ